MKIVWWDDETVPFVIAVVGDDTVVEDSRFEFNLEIGDMVQYRTEVGTSLYRVVELVPITVDFDGYPDYCNLVTIRGI